MLRVYKPRPKLAKVKGVKLTGDNIQEAASIFRGRLSVKEGTVVGLDITDFDGLKHFPLGTWIVKKDDNSLVMMTNEEFEDAYEVARNTDKSS